MDRKTCSLFRKVDYHSGVRYLPMNVRKLEKGVESECLTSILTHRGSPWEPGASSTEIRACPCILCHCVVGGVGLRVGLEIADQDAYIVLAFSRSVAVDHRSTIETKRLSKERTVPEKDNKRWGQRCVARQGCDTVFSQRDRLRGNKYEEHMRAAYYKRCSMHN